MYALHAVADPNYSIDRPYDRPVTPQFCYPFCKLGEEEVDPRKRNHLYARPDSLGRHIRNQNLTEQNANEGFDCPYEECSAFLGGAEHFLELHRPSA